MRWFVLALLLSCACRAPVQECDRTSLLQPVLPLGITGEPVEVEVYHPELCYAGDVTARVSVLDPANAPLDVTLLEVKPRLSGKVSAKFSLTPTMPGSHHVTVRFEPNLGLEQLDLDVAADRRQAPAVMELAGAPWDTCRHVDVLPSGKPICLATPSGRMGSTVWTTEGSTVVRSVEGDAGLARAPDLGLFLDADLILPGVDDAVVFSSDVTARLVFLDGGALEAGPVLPHLGLTHYQNWTAWRDAEGWILLEPNACMTYYTDGGFCGVLPFGTLAFLGTDSSGVFSSSTGATPAPMIAHSNPVSFDTTPAPSNFAPVDRERAEWDTGAMLTSDAGEAVLVGWDGRAFTFAAFGRVKSATSQWVLVERAGKLLLLHR